MPVAVAVAEDADMPRIFEISSLAFGTNEPFWDMAWPGHHTEAGRKSGAARMLKTKNSDPTTTFLKAYDPSTGVIMGMAKWNIYNHSFPSPSPVDETLSSDAQERAYITQLLHDFLVERNGAIQRSNGCVVSLDILAVDPAYQRKGAGAALVQWGTSKADELGFEAVVESSVFGKPLYESKGFVFIKDVDLSWPEPIQDRPMKGFAWLVRPKTSR